MDPPFIHHSRYIAVSSPNPNFYAPSPSSHVYNFRPQPPAPQQQPLPLPPPPPQQSLPAPPPPPPLHHPPLSIPAPPPLKNPYNSHHHPQLSFNPNFNLNSNPKSLNLDHDRHHHHQRSHDFVHRIRVDDDRHHHHHRQRLVPEFETRPDVWDSPRIVPGHRPVVNNLEHHRQFDDRPVSPRSIEKVKHDVPMNHRFRERYNNDVFEFEHKNASSNQRLEFVSRRSLFVSDSDRLNSGNYENIHGSQFDSNEMIRSNVRDGVFERQALRERGIRDSMIEMGQNSQNGSGGVRSFSGKREFYGPDSGRYGNNRVSRENNFEYNRTPRKQVQKKSALLRLQKPCFRTRENGELHYFDEMKSGSFRGKDKIIYLDHGLGAEEEREGSPVELDVSFKSNSLVAKAIVAPLSSAVVSDPNITPKNGKNRKFVVSDKDRSSPQLNRVCDSSIKLDSSRDVVNNASNSDKNMDSKQSGKKVAPSAIFETHDHNLQSCTTQAKDSPAKVRVVRSKCIVSGKGGTDDSTSITSSHKVAKKKRVVKKLVKKVITPNADVSSLQPTEKLDEPVKADGSTLKASAAPLLKKEGKPSKRKITLAGATSVHSVDLEPGMVLPVDGRVGESSQAAMGPEEVNTDVDSGGSHTTKMKRKMRTSISPLACTSNKETKIEEGYVNADNSFSHIQKTGKDLTKSLNKTTVTDIGSSEVAGEQFCRKGNTLLLENSSTKESPKILFPVGGDISSDVLSLEENKKHEANVFAHGMNATAGFNNGLVSSLEKITDSDIPPVDDSSKKPCKSQGSSVVEGFPMAVPPGTSSEMSALSSSEEIKIHNVSISADCSNHDSGRISGSDNVCINSEVINISGGYIGKQLLTDGVTISLEKGVTGRLSNAIVSGGGGEDMPNITDKNKVMNSLSDLPDAMITDMKMEPLKAVSSTQCVDTTVCSSITDSRPAEAKVNGSLHFGLQPSLDGFSDLHGSNSMGDCSEAKVTISSGFIGPSPENRKRRKVSACQPGFPSEMTSEISEGPITTDLFTSGLELPSNMNEVLMQPEGEFTVSNMATPLSFVSTDVFEARDGESLKVDHTKADSCSHIEESCIPIAASSCLPVFGSDQMVNATPVMDDNNHSNEVMYMEDSGTQKMDAVAAGKQVTVCTETTQLKTTSELQSSDLNQRLPGTVMESDGYHLESDDLPSVSTYLALAVEGDGVSTTNSSDETMEFDTTLSDMGSPEILSDRSVMQSFHPESSASQNSNEKVCGNEKMPNEKPVTEGISNLFSNASSLQCVKNNLKSGSTLESAHLVDGRSRPSPSSDVKFAANNLNSRSGETYGKKNQLSHAASRVPSSRSSFVFNSTKNTASSTQITKPRTWHRTENSSTPPIPGNKSFLRAIPQSHLPKKVAKSQSMSYIRKGNSLVRKPAPDAANPQGSHGLTSSVYLSNSGVGESKKTTLSDSRAVVLDPPNLLGTEGVNAPFERPRTPPLATVTKVPNRTTNFSGDCTSSPLSEALPNGCSEATSDPQKVVESNNALKSSNDASKASETHVNQTGSVNSLESQVELNDGALSASNMKRITYVKRKSNQLVAASNHHSSSIQNADKTQGITSDSYYKRRKNQLIRTPVESHINPTVTLLDGSSISEGKAASKDIFSRSFSKKRSFKAVTKIQKPSRFSLVWTLKSLQSAKDDDHFSYPQKVLPSLFPWKRTAYRRRFVQNSISISNNSSLSSISRKLLLLRKRDTVYTRSNHGFSLRKSKVLSVGGSSLKWSKSIENRSKKANEEATLAVAAVGRGKREQNGAKSFASETKSRSHSSRERIFRIGSVRYKMDSSRRTLQRISDDESTGSAALNSEKNAKKSYIPRRLVIGNDEYVRIGNGNQLIRDPKKRTRVLASEKVRWSLHTARLRLARKRKYCQFFTRFGKCNKEDGKCPYIHDPSKIAVCTKFLNGLCSNSNCKLTHKVIPERMPDCSYFLQGLCSNKDCPYRHVHVNPKASTCKGFLKGYCADGNECRKKHSYVCPTFEATGSCPLGLKCKLHHPKSRSKGKKIRRSREQKNNRGRYFGSVSIEDSEPRKTMSERHSMQDNGNICFEGKFSDYIRLNVSDEAAGETNDTMSEQTTCDDINDSHLHLDDLDELVRPIRIMNLR